MISNRVAIQVIEQFNHYFKLNIRSRKSDLGPSAERFGTGITARRMQAMYILHKLGLSYADIGRLFKRDHTTAIHACKKIEEKLASVAGYDEEMGILETIANGVITAAKERGGREKLPDERMGITHHFTIITKDGDLDGYLTVNAYEDGRVAEFFVKLGKQGDFHAIMDQWAVACSIALQLGMPLEKFMKKFVDVRFEPSGMTKNPEIPMCSSLVDYVSKFLLKKYVKQSEVTNE